MQGHYVRGSWRHGGSDRCPVYFIPDVKIFFFHRLRCGKTHALLSSSVLGYKGKSGAVPQKVLVYCLFWVSPDFFPHTKKLVQTAFVWVKTLVTLYGCRPTYGTPRVHRRTKVHEFSAVQPSTQKKFTSEMEHAMHRLPPPFLYEPLAQSTRMLKPSLS